MFFFFFKKEKKKKKIELKLLLQGMEGRTSRCATDYRMGQYKRVFRRVLEVFGLR